MSKTKEMILSGLFAALIAIFSLISIPLPFSQVPVTLQTLGVMLAALLLPPRATAGALVVYLLLGAIGLPIYAGGTGGVGVLFGPTGGYLLGFLIGGVALSLTKERVKSLWLVTGATLFFGIVIVNLLGSAGLMWMLGIDYAQALTIGVIPFIPGDLLKAVLSVFLYQQLHGRIHRIVGT